MIHSIRFKAVLDTNVIFPIEIRDLLFWFAHYELYTPKWSQNIFDEWKRVMVRKGISENEVLKRVSRATQAFPDALVHNYDSLIADLKLPDEDDCHVLAAAIRTNANVIVTNNLKDFPEEYLDSFGLKVKSADDFLTDIIDLNQDKAIEAFKEMVLNRKNPAMDEYQVLESLRRNGLKDTADYLHALL
ncbi:MAG: PIN domain-containing protein [Chryseobacterium sp.]|uniref:PIN domain-containing protein n=1 Tax=Pedobacter agri TaxID=454586 RepID=A0A9X3DAG7_9SPHI|nr:PIN domain-containing protein [Pedobacter agri]MCX3263737.1 PIN domain-containing protein [Pedobacter agri]RZJ90507.1 MAG: PIN domain-containing protein [Chryseobacterium sp.]